MPECTEQNCFDIAEESQGKNVIEHGDEKVLFNASLIYGTILACEGFLPLLVWYLFRDTGIRSIKDGNGWYYRAWWLMYVSHYFVFGLPATLWPFTYFGSQAVNDMYILLSYFLVTLAGLAVVSLNTALFTLAYLTYDTNAKVGKTRILFETLSYLVFTVGAFFFADIYVIEDTFEYL
mmetsp:Transcript_29189/g.38859  ORF Transcript_29189/g.38859 Transcript_29189/m.38859 type:complete len:178 (+) Transcript_29189:796-1329(+)